MVVHQSTTSFNTREQLCDFVEICAINIWYCRQGWITHQVAADNSWLVAETSGLVAELGADAVQRVMSTAFDRAALGWLPSWLNDIRHRQSEVAA